MKAVLLVIALLGPFQSLDRAVRERVQGARTPGGSKVFQEVSDFGRPVTVLGALILIAIFDRAAGPATVMRALVALAPANLLVEIGKRTSFRVRPDGERKRSNASFPSSHAANGAALATVLSRRWRRLAPAFIAFALAVAWARVYLDRHWLSDVLVGLALGYLCAWFAERWLSRRERRLAAGVEKPLDDVAPASGRDAPATAVDPAPAGGGDAPAAVSGPPAGPPPA